jgi:hypothetical protein
MRGAPKVMSALAALALFTVSCGGPSSSPARTSTSAVPPTTSTSVTGTTGSTSTTTSTTLAGGTTATTTAVTSTTASAPAGPSPCTTSGLTGSEVQPRGTAGEVIAEFVVENTGGASCTLDGYPNVSLFGAVNGVDATLPFTATHYQLTGAPPLGVAPARFTLAPAGKAAFYVVFYQVQSGTSPCDQVGGIEFQAPSSDIWKAINYRVYACEPQVQLSALQTA